MPIIYLLALLAAASAFAQQAPAPTVPDTVEALLNVEYSRVGEPVAMDIYRPKTKGPHPAVLAIHGGGFRGGRRQSYAALCIRLAERGYVAATASYRLSPKHQFPAALEDVKAAVRHLRANAAKYNVDASHIGVTGASAGGTLALLLGSLGGLPHYEGTGPHLDQSSKVQAVVNYFGATDFTRIYDRGGDAADVLPLWLGGDQKHARRAHIESSALYWVTPASAPTLTVHGTRDPLVPYDHGLWITTRLQEASVEAAMETMLDAGHGFRGADAERAEARLMLWFDRYLKPAGQTRLLLSDHGVRGEVLEMLWPSGQELWTVPNKRGHDVQPLPGGGALFTVGPDKKVVEIDAAHKEVWTCCDGLDHPLAAQRLANGNTLIGDARAGRVIEVNPSKQVVWEYKTPDLVNMRMRNATRTDKDTTIIAVEAEAKIIEVDRAGKIVWQWQAPEGSKRRAYMGLRLANGNTVIPLNEPGEVVEVDPAGKVVRSIAGDKMDIRMVWASGLAQLPNGNLLINDYLGRRMMEVDSKGNIVHQLKTGARMFASIRVIGPQ
ncbi:MAG: alpha/beta hydrolase fold domain-containing protein [Bryobacterales bacterium]|nr:alpha/beta hydrolase fold domain-containing protein [Bryobacterales bacterium]